jgi:hypothetical protein
MTDLLWSASTPAPSDILDAMVLMRSGNVLQQLSIAAILAAAGIPIGAEIPVGAINGTNLIYTLANTPFAGSVPMIFTNNGLLNPNTDYTLVGSTITLTTALKGASTGYPADTILVWYRK